MLQSLTRPVTLPNAVLPTLKGGDAVLLTYDGLPDDQDWLAIAQDQSRVCASPKEVEELREYCAEPSGAPIGSYASTSTRVARVTGLLVDNARAPELLAGVALAHGRVSAGWQDTEEGRFLVLQFMEPTAFGWGAAKNGLCQEQLKVRCIRQYLEQSKSLLDHVADLAEAHALNFEFAGEWDDTSTLLRRRLIKSCLAHWAALQNFPLAA